MDPVWDVIVVGAGVMGLSSALFCKKQGLNVLLLEQFPYPHSRGSSHGASRITRKSSIESPVISKMMKECYDLWKMIEEETNSKIFWPIGTMYIQKKPAQTLRRVAEVNDQWGYKYSLLDGADIHAKYGHVFANYDDYLGLLDHEGGLLRSDYGCARILELYKKLGGEFMDLVPVKNVKPSKDITALESEDGRIFKTKKLIISVGAWTAKLAEQLSVNLPLKAEAISVTYWRAKDNTKCGTSTLPCFIDITGDCYGLPSFEYPGMIKIVRRRSDEICDPDNRDVSQFKIEKLMEFYEPFIKKHFPNLMTLPAVVERCMYTRSPDSCWIIDKHPSNENIVFLAGFSGHGFKAGPIIGKIASQMVSGATIEYDLTEFRIDRFKKVSNL